MFFDYLPDNGFVCAHRGARSIAPENTLLSMEKAKECGAHCWETDVRTSSDGQLIIFHDETLERTTDIESNGLFKDRLSQRVDQFSAEKLQQLDAGSWFLRDDPFATVANGEVVPEEREKIKSQKIPLLSEILEFTKKHSFPVNVEIKDLQTPAGNTAIVDSIMDMLKDTETLDLVLLSSFRHEYLRRAKEIDKNIAIGVLTTQKFPSKLSQYLRSMSADAYHPKQSRCDSFQLNKLQQDGFRVNIWAIKDLISAKKLLAAGAGVITDWPQRLTTGE